MASVLANIFQGSLSTTTYYFFSILSPSQPPQYTKGRQTTRVIRKRFESNEICESEEPTHCATLSVCSLLVFKYEMKEKEIKKMYKIVHSRKSFSKLEIIAPLHNFNLCQVGNNKVSHLVLDYRQATVTLLQTGLFSILLCCTHLE